MALIALVSSVKLRLAGLLRSVGKLCLLGNEWCCCADGSRTLQSHRSADCDTDNEKRCGPADVSTLRWVDTRHDGHCVEGLLLVEVVQRTLCPRRACRFCALKLNIQGVMCPSEVLVNVYRLFIQHRRTTTRMYFSGLQSPLAQDRAPCSSFYRRAPDRMVVHVHSCQ